VLRRAPWLLKHELEKRGYHSSKIRENVEAELVGVCISEALAAQEKVHELDTTEKTPEQTLNEAMDALEKGGYSPGEIDWLSHPEALELIKELDECT
jgi:adenylate kinase